MRSPITKISVAAAVVVAVLIGISQFGGSPAGVAWGQVAQRVQASRGVIYRELRGRERPTTDKDRTITYLTPTDYRSDGFREGELWMTMWDDRAAGKRVVLLYAQKEYALEDFPLTEQGNRKHANYQDPTWWVQTFLACKYSKLEPKTIDGLLCEGIETTDLALLADHQNDVKSLVARLWVSVETGYPVLFDGEFHGQETSHTIFDQFQWDVAIDPSVFEPSIPAGYEQM
ncbi:MAG: hypothetical protein ABFE01_03525 [Phycisphaerales bacterium]